MVKFKTTRTYILFCYWNGLICGAVITLIIGYLIGGLSGLVTGGLLGGWVMAFRGPTTFFKHALEELNDPQNIYMCATLEDPTDD